MPERRVQSVIFCIQFLLPIKMQKKKEMNKSLKKGCEKIKHVLSVKDVIQFQIKM